MASHRTLCWMLLVLLCVADTARADSAGEFSSVLTLTTNYFHRGYSKSDNNPTVRANLDYQHKSGVFLGTWISRVDFGDHHDRDRSSVEFYPYVGFNLNLPANWRFETTVARYLYDAKIFGRHSDYNEYRAALSYGDLLTASVAFADNAYNRGRDSRTYEISSRYPIAEKWQVSGGMGYNEALHLTEYNTVYWNLGVTWYFYKYVALDLRYVDYVWTSVGKLHGLALPYIDDKFLFSISFGI